MCVRARVLEIHSFQHFLFKKRKKFPNASSFSRCTKSRQG